MKATSWIEHQRLNTNERILEVALERRLDKRCRGGNRRSQSGIGKSMQFQTDSRRPRDVVNAIGTNSIIYYSILYGSIQYITVQYTIVCNAILFVQCAICGDSGSRKMQAFTSQQLRFDCCQESRMTCRLIHSTTYCKSIKYTALQYSISRQVW